jgi:uncharacterized repeat protein (TIGR01451 family)
MTALACLLVVCCVCTFFAPHPTTVRAAGRSASHEPSVSLKPNELLQPSVWQNVGGPAQMSLSAAMQIQALETEKATRTPAQKKMDSNLLYALKMATGKEIAPGVARMETGVTVQEGFVEVDIRTSATEDVATLVKKLGGRDIASFDFAKSVNAKLPVSQLEAVAGDARVAFVGVPGDAITNAAEAPAGTPSGGAAPDRPASFDVRRERIRAKLRNALAAAKRGDAQSDAITIPGIRLSTSEADVRHRTRAARATFDVDGTGLRIGILSNSFDQLNGYAADIASGELPGPGNPNGFTTPVRLAGSGDFAPPLTVAIDEGRAMAQLIHAVAPGAQLFYATAFNGVADFANNIRALRGIAANPGPFGNVPGGCDIIVDDVFSVVESGLHQGQSGTVVSQFNMALIQQAVNDVTADGALYFSSAGNSGNLNDGTSGAWEGDFTSAGDAPAPLAGMGTPLNWTPGAATANPLNTITATPSALGVSMQWSDPLGSSTNDYDLFVLNAAGTAVVAASTLIQDGTGLQDPFERVAGPAVVAGTRLVILLRRGQPRFISLSTNRGRLQFGTDGQTRGHSCAIDGFGVAATPTAPAGRPAFPNPFAANNVVETFSSDGRRRSFFAPNGSVLGNGQLTAAGGGGSVAQKPDITAADGSPTTVPGFERFFGTSAAAPHACAIAALVKQAFMKNGVPNPTPAQIRTILQNTALDIEEPGTDRDSGVGILQGFQAVQATGAGGGAGIDFESVTAIEGAVSNNNGFVEPGETANLTVNLSNLGIADASNVTAVVASLTPGVIVLTPNARSYGTIAPSANTPNAVPFTFLVGPAAACGASADFALTVNFSGGVGGASPRVIRFRVPTGRTGFTVTSNLDAAAPQPNSFYTATTGTSTGLLNVLGGAASSSCALAQPNPGAAGGTAPRRFDAYTFSNSGTTTTCVSVNLTPPAISGAGAANTLYSAAYSTFTPATPGNGYLAYGRIQFVGQASSYSFNLPAGQSATVVVGEFAPNGAAGLQPPFNTYTLSVSGLTGNCQPSGVAQATVNDRMSLTVAGAPQIVAPTCGMQGSANDLILNATVTNTGTTAVQTIAFQVVELREANGTPPATPFRLISADGASCAAGGLVGAVQTLTMPAALPPGQSAPVQFRIAAPAVRRLRFLVNVLGIDTGAVGNASPKRTLTAAAALGFEVDFNGKRGTSVAVTRPAAPPAGGAGFSGGRAAAK